MGFIKYSDAPVFGNTETGTVFDGYVWMENGRYRMDFSWRGRKSCAVTFSDDGIHWEDRSSRWSQTLSPAGRMTSTATA